jgi:lysophospholipase L1-like esterase
MFPLRLSTILALWFVAMSLCDATTILNCVGDSITAGVGVSGPLVAIQSYPARLQQLVGTNYIVGNKGLSGATLLTNGDLPYFGSTTYSGSLKFSPRIFVIMLGSNDSKPQNWVYGTNFYSNYVNLIGAYTNLASHPRVMLCTPPPAFNNGAFAINPGIVATNISPIVRQLGSDLNLQVIDMQTLLAGHSEWFPDNVHPNSQGAMVMAAIVYAAVSGDTLNGTIPGVAISTLTNRNAILKWPAGGAGWVLQSTSNLSSTNTWLIASNSVAIGNDGTSLSFTNSMATPSALFRLWNPSPGGN